MPHNTCLKPHIIQKSNSHSIVLKNKWGADYQHCKFALIMKPAYYFHLKASASLFVHFMGRPGFEPGTNRLKAEYSTVELATLAVCFATLPS